MRLVVPALGQPEVRPPFEQQGAGDAGRRGVAQPMAGVERRLGRVQLVHLRERLDQGKERPHERGRRAVALLEVEGQLCVGMGFVDPAEVEQRDGAHEAAVRQGDQPSLGAGDLDQPVAQPAGGVQLAVGDQQELRGRAHQ